MITLRRYPFPTNDSVSSSEEVQKLVDFDNLKPVATMISFLGEDTGNKMSSIIGPIETGLLWKDLEAKVWEQLYRRNCCEVTKYELVARLYREDTSKETDDKVLKLIKVYVNIQKKI
jgi:hypothetical protein